MSDLDHVRGWLSVTFHQYLLTQKGEGDVQTFVDWVRDELEGANAEMCLKFPPTMPCPDCHHFHRMSACGACECQNKEWR